MVNKLCSDHYSWLRHQKFNKHVSPFAVTDDLSSKWDSPPSAKSPKLDFKCMTEEKVTDRENDLQRNMLSIFSVDSASKK